MRSFIKTFSNLTIAAIIAVVGLFASYTANAHTTYRTIFLDRPISFANDNIVNPDTEIEAITSELAIIAPELAPYLRQATSEEAVAAKRQASSHNEKVAAYQQFRTDSLTLDQIPYINVTYTGDDVPPYDLDKFCERAGTVIFKVNNTYIEPSNPFLQELRNNLLPLIRQQQLQLYRIDLRGAASPEGPIANNQRLANGRARALRDSITTILPSVDGDIINMSSVTEDYELLIHYMQKADDPDAAIVQDIYNRLKTQPAQLKAALIAAKQKTLWPRLLKEYFPRLRATRVILYFHIAPDATPVEPVVEPLPPYECQCRGQLFCHCGEEGIQCPCYEEYLEGGSCSCILPEAYYTVSDTIHRRPILAIGTNLVYDLWYMPDYGFAPMWNGRLEWYPYSDRHNFWNHTSLAIAFVNPYWHKWAQHKFYQIRNYEIEGRWYHRYEKESGQRYGWYLGAAIENNIFGIGLSDTRGWQGEGLGAQVTGGYVLPLDKCKSWKLEFNIGAGFYETHYDPYIYEDPFDGSQGGHGEYNPPTVNPDEGDKLHYYYKWYGAAKDFKLRQWRYRWFGPMQVGISLKYDFLWKRQQRRGASFHHTEVVSRTYSSRTAQPVYATPAGYQTAPAPAYTTEKGGPR